MIIQSGGKKGKACLFKRLYVTGSSNVVASVQMQMPMDCVLEYAIIGVTGASGIASGEEQIGQLSIAQPLTSANLFFTQTPLDGVLAEVRGCESTAAGIITPPPLFVPLEVFLEARESIWLSVLATTAGRAWAVLKLVSG